MKTKEFLERVDFIKQNYTELGKTECAKRLGISKKKVEYLREKFGLIMTPEAKSKARLAAVSKKENELSVNPNHFIHVSTAEAAYLLGFIWADGHISDGGCTPCVSIGQSFDDMETLKPILAKVGRWNFMDIKKQKLHHKQCCKAYISNRILYEYLSKHGYTSKSWVSAKSIIETIPENLKHYFYLGLFDGDGCLFVKKEGRRRYVFSISSSFEQDWGYMEDLCKKLKIEYRICQFGHKVKTKDGSRYQAAGIFSILKYSDINIIMSIHVSK